MVESGVCSRLQSMGVPLASAERHHVFTPLDLEIIDLVYEAAWAQIIARPVPQFP